MEDRTDPRDFHRCDVCDCYGTRSLFNILRHVRQHRHPDVFACYNNIPANNKCKYCDFETNLKVSLTYHWNLNHNNNPKNQNLFGSALRQCGSCDFQTHSMLLLLKHCLNCDKNGILKTTNTVTWLECGQCSFKTQNKRYLRRHVMEMHSTLYHCEKCSFTTKNKRYLRQHVYIKHSNLKNSKSSNKTAWKTSSKQLRTNIHTDSANIVWHHCDKCEFKTKWKESLKQHIANMHTDSVNIVWYHCDSCEYKSKWKNDLRKHITYTHADPANVVWHRCDSCEYKAKKKIFLKKHIAKIHF